MSDPALLIFSLHNKLLRCLSDAAGVHFQGLGAASRFHRGLPRDMRKKLALLDFTFGVTRHIPASSVSDSVNKVSTAVEKIPKSDGLNEKEKLERKAPAATQTPTATAAASPARTPAAASESNNVFLEKGWEGAAEAAPALPCSSEACATLPASPCFVGPFEDLSSWDVTDKESEERLAAGGAVQLAVAPAAACSAPAVDESPDPPYDCFQWNASAPDFVPERSLEPLQRNFNDLELLQAVNAEAIDLGLVVGPVSHLSPEQQEFDEQFEHEEYMEREFGKVEGPGSAKAIAEAEELKNRGNDLYKKRMFKEALQMYNMAIEKDPDKVVYSYKCAVWIEMGRPQYLAEAVETGLSLLTRAGDMTSKVQQRVATAIARLAVWNFSCQCFKAWEEQTFGGDGSESRCSSKGWPSDHSFGD